MKKIGLLLAVAGFTFIVSCKSADKKEAGETMSPKAQADSLEKQVIEGHDVAMHKSMKIPDLQKETKRLIDSIRGLPAKAQEAAAPFKAKLEVAYQELRDAGASMEKWMDEFDYDSAKDNLEQRIKYLADEKLRVEKVKEAVLESVRKADAMLKEKH